MNLLRTIAWKTPFQTAQRNSFKEVRKEPGDVRIFAGERQKKKQKQKKKKKKKQKKKNNS